jgi:Fungal Zn(2)-Cys(6) binuclear cluster domain
MNGHSILPDPGAAASSGPRGLVEVPGRTARKRHRPALSCVQCRRRKVKCDRKLPCSQCSQYNNAACAYDDPEVVAARGKSDNQILHDSSTTLGSDQGYGHRNQRQPIVFNTPLTTGLPNLHSRSPTTSVPWSSAPLAEHAQSEHNESERSIAVGTPHPDASIQELRDRVQKLEAIISSSSNYGPQPENDSHLSSTNIPKLRGNIEKTRFFGMNHWMNTYDEVCTSSY